MTIITQDGYDPGDDPAGVPLIGYDNKITEVTATSAESGFAASNLLNPATHLFWQGEDAGAQTLGISTSGEVDYLAIARHNFFDSGARIGLVTSNNSDIAAGYLQLLLHNDGTEASPDIIDSSGNDVPIGGGLLIRTAQSKFGGASVQFAGGQITVQGFPTFNVGTSDFTIDFWVRHDALGSNEVYLDAGSETNAFRILKNSSNFLVFRAQGSDRITGASALTATTWHHVAVARSSGSTRLFLNGVQQGSTFTDALTYTPEALVAIGRNLAAGQTFVGYMDEIRVLIGRAAYTGAFTAPTAAYDSTITTMFGAYSALFHFDGVDASTTITDSGGANHTFTVQGNAQLDTAQFKFGTASALFDGTGDFLVGDGSDDFAFGTLDFTIDFWVRFNALGSQRNLYDSRPDGATVGPYVYILKDTDDKIKLFVDGAFKITGTTVVTTGTWFHVAVTRVSGSTRLFLNGVQEGSTYSDTTAYINGTNAPIIGASFNGWIDELRVIKGTGLWSNSFSVPLHAASAQSVLGRTIDVEDATPLLFRFTSTSNDLGLRIESGSDAAQIAVIYAGELLVLERSIKADVQHMNVIHARQSNVLSGMSESGNFLGRVLTSEWRESQAEFAWFTPDWYRENFEPFAESAMTLPFFWAWNPDEYPDEVTFAWIIEDIRPETDPATRRVAATIIMRAIA